MKLKLKKLTSKGFGGVEALLILVIVVGIIGIGAYVLTQSNKTGKTVSSTSSQLSNSKSTPTQKITAAPGTASSIQQITAQDAQTEQSADKSGDAVTQNNINSANSSTNNVGGSYNEASL